MKVILLGASNPEAIRMINAIKRINPSFEVLGFIDNNPLKKNTDFWGYRVFGGYSDLLNLNMDQEDLYFVNLITRETITRYETSKYLAEHGCNFTNFIHPTIDLTMVQIGLGNYLQENVIVQAECVIGNNSSISYGAIIGHETKIGHSVFIAPGASIAGIVNISDGVFIGTNATICPRVKIGKWATIGAGAVVKKDVPDYATVVGNPGKVIKISEVNYTKGDIF